MLQDVGRYGSFRLLKPHLALVSDATWFIWVCLVSGWLLLNGTQGTEPALLVILWGIGATFALIPFAALLHIRRTPIAAAKAWWTRTAWPFGRPLLLESGVYALGNQVVWLLVAASLGATALGTLRTYQVVFAPIQVVTTGFGLFAIPELASADSSPTARRWWPIIAAPTLVALIGSVLVFGAAPRLIPIVTNESVQASLLVAIGVGVVLSAAGSGASILLRAWHATQALFPARLLSSCAALAVLFPLMHFGGIAGAAFTLVVGATLYAAILFRAIRRILRIAGGGGVENQRPGPAVGDGRV
jgi:O-antigen/teichoic acid export membrane protein